MGRGLAVVLSQASKTTTGTLGCLVLFVREILEYPHLEQVRNFLKGFRQRASDCQYTISGRDESLMNLLRSENGLVLDALKDSAV
jgi:hypothetical protein